MPFRRQDMPSCARCGCVLGDGEPVGKEPGVGTYHARASGCITALGRRIDILEQMLRDMVVVEVTAHHESVLHVCRESSGQRMLLGEALTRLPHGDACRCTLQAVPP